MKNHILNRIIPVPNSGCWIWEHTINTRGYGQTSINGERFTAHRLSWIAFNGPIPGGLCVLHKCDVRCCVNPDHLFLGTREDNNNKDRTRKGRTAHPIGTKNNRAILTPDKVQQIRADTRILKHVAKDFGISIAQVWRIRTNQHWQHLSPIQP